MIDDASPSPEALLSEIIPRLAQERVIAVDWQGTPAFAKRASRVRIGEKLMLAILAPLGRRYLVPSLRFEPVLRRSPRPFEVDRLIELHAAGVRVPRVLAAADSAFVIESVGKSLDHVLSAEPHDAGRMRWLLDAADDLSAFHRAGHWHGAAQIRNVAVSSRGLARFDFDRDIDQNFPLVMLQALDASLFLSSLTGVVDSDSLHIVSERYFAASPDDVRALIWRCRGVVGWLVGLGLFRKLARKEWVRMQVLHRALDAARPNGQATSAAQ